jgi:predicted transcriptional regulator
MQHKGEIVERAVRRSGYKLTELVKRIGKSRRWIYNAFENPNLSIDHVLEIGKVIHYDFSDEINELKGMKKSLHEPPAEYLVLEDTVAYWKEKYYKLLEKHNALLETK